jgi:hypothetical protein
MKALGNGSGYKYDLVPESISVVRNESRSSPLVLKRMDFELFLKAVVRNDLGLSSFI